MKYFLLFLLLAGCFSCTTKTPPVDKGTAVSGVFTLGCDEAYRPLMQTLADGFMATYPGTVIYIESLKGVNAYSVLGAGKIRSVATSMPLLAEDSAALRNRNVFPQSFHFATDALVLITNAGDSATRFRFTDPSLSCIENVIKPRQLKIVTANTGSENNLLLFTVNPANKACSSEWFGVESQERILQQVSTNSNLAGLVGWSHLCEKENPKVKIWRQSIAIMPFENSENKLIYPTQSDLQSGAYPLNRKLMLVTTEPYAGPATGFASYVASDVGQRIIRLFGIAPAKTPPREILFN